MVNLIPLPKRFSIPTVVDFAIYRLEPLHPKHNEIDFAAWNSSKESLNGIFGPDNPWPNDVCSSQENFSDLELHYKEFLNREAFTYTVLAADGSQCIGCLYIRKSAVALYQCRVDFWLIDSVRPELETSFFHDIRTWLSSTWKFTHVAFPGRTLSWETWKALERKEDR